MNAMDGGGTVPLFMAKRLDISAPVTEQLNKQYRERAGSAKVPPKFPSIDEAASKLPPAHSIRTRTFELPVM